MKKGQKKLNLRKIKISKLNNLHLIRAGSDNAAPSQNQSYPQPASSCCDSQTVVQSATCERDPETETPNRIL